MTRDVDTDGLNARILGGYRYDWDYFADWCAAYSYPSLPTSPVTVARFLSEDPAAPGTLRRRVTAINAAHRAVGHELPGTVSAVRRLLSQRDRWQERALGQIPRLPIAGWPEGLFGRRDALLLWLVCVAGVPASSIPALKRGDVVGDGNGILIRGGHDIELPIDPGDMWGILPVWRRWARIQEVIDARFTTTALVSPLIVAKPVDPTGVPSLRIPDPPARDGALIPPFTKNGGLAGLSDDGLSADGVRAVLVARLGIPKRQRRAVVTVAEESVPSHDRAEASGDDDPAAPTGPEFSPVDGVLKRRQAQDQLGDLDGAFSDIDRKAAALMERMERLLATDFASGD
jgi:hypothetical protein